MSSFILLLVFQALLGFSICPVLYYSFSFAEAVVLYWHLGLFKAVRTI